MADTLVAYDSTVPSRPTQPSGRLRRQRRWPWTFVVLTSLAVAGWFGGQYVAGLATVAARTPESVTAASHFDSLPWPIRSLFIVHIVSAAMALAVGPFQFSQRLRRRSMKAHRYLGRLYLISVLFASLSGATTSFWNSLGIRGVIGYLTLDVLWGCTAWLGYRAARARRLREHQAWMIRNFALTYAAVTLRAGLPVLILVQLPFGSDSSFPELFENAVHTIAPWLGWLINIVVAEWLISRRGLPGVRWSSFQENRRERVKPPEASRAGMKN